MISIRSSQTFVRVNVSVTDSPGVIVLLSICRTVSTISGAGWPGRTALPGSPCNPGSSGMLTIPHPGDALEGSVVCTSQGAITHREMPVTMIARTKEHATARVGRLPMSAGISFQSQSRCLWAFTCKSISSH